MAPAPNDEHQEIEINLLANRFWKSYEDAGLGYPYGRAINVASDPADWERDYRIPDIAVFLTDSTAVCHDAFWSGPPDFIIEIVSPGIRREEARFYARSARASCCRRSRPVAVGTVSTARTGHLAWPLVDPSSE